MRLNVLGPVLVEADDGSDLTPRGGQQRKLLAALVLASPGTVSAGELNELLWPSRPVSANALQAQVSKLRRAVGPIEIASDGRGYALRTQGEATIDIVEFESLVESGRHSAAAGRHAEAAARLATALGLIRGAPLADLDGSELAEAPRARITALARAARAAYLEARLALGHHGEVAAELEALVAAEPFDEHWWGLLMTAQYRQGRQADALRTYQAARRALAGELGLEPGPALRDLERRVLAQDPLLLDDGRAGSSRSARSTRRAAALPARLTSLIGRDAFLEEVAAESAHHRLVTLVGPGGTGKTSVALELARRRADQVELALLAPVTDSDAVIDTLAAAVGVATGDAPLAAAAASTFDRIVDALAGEALLLVVDNCEHVIEAAAKHVHTLLEACPSLSVLATSREALGVPGEIVRIVPPLADRDAVSLFVERASAVAPGARFDDARELAVVVDICARLDGLPLAIELAAARLRSMAPGELLQRLADRFTVLSAGQRTAERRQQTLRAVVDWSHDLLDEHERIVFRRFAVFSGGAAMSSIEHVCSDGVTLAAQQVAGIVERLVDKSLLVVDRRHDVHRLWMLQTIGDYAVERLHESGEAERVRHRHARHVADMLAPALRELTGRRQREWIELISIERDNLRTAVDIAVARGDSALALDLVAPVGWYFYMLGQPEPGAAALADALACPRPADPSVRAIVLAHLGWLAANGPNVTEAIRVTADAVQLLERVDDPWVESFVMTTRMMTMFFAGDLAEVRRLFPIGNDAAARSGDPWAAAIMAIIDGEIAQFDGEAERAERSFAKAIDVFEDVGDDFSLSIALTEAADIAEMRGDYDGAIALLARGIELGDRVGFSSKPMATRARLANVETLRGDLVRAECLHRSVLDGLRDNSLPWVQTMSCLGLANIARRTGRLDEAADWGERAWSLPRTQDVPIMRMNAQAARGYTADQRGDHRCALARQVDGLRTAVAHRGPRSLANALEGVAGALAAAPGRAGHELGAQLLGAADALRRRSGGPMPAAERFDVNRAEHRLRAALGDEAYRAGFATGGDAATDELAAEALGLA